jgi:hypothetical protein
MITSLMDSRYLLLVIHPDQYRTSQKKKRTNDDLLVGLTIDIFPSAYIHRQAVKRHDNFVFFQYNDKRKSIVDDFKFI